MAGNVGRAGRPAGGRSRPPAQVVAPSRPWGLIATAVATAVFAAAAIGYAVVRSGEAEAGEITSADQIEGVTVVEHAGGLHTAEPVVYEQSPPVGGRHDIEWADCTGTVYDLAIRDENAVHSLEHGAVWITYDPDAVAGADLAVLEELTEGRSGTLLSPYPGLDSPISLQSWGHQLRVDSPDDERIAQFTEFLRYHPALSPEPGASCENPAFAADPLPAGAPSRTG